MGIAQKLGEWRMRSYIVTILNCISIWKIPQQVKGQLYLYITSKGNKTIFDLKVYACAMFFFHDCQIYRAEN